MKRLQLVAQIFTNAMTRRRAEAGLRTHEARLASGADLAGLGFFEVEFDDRVMYADDRLRDVCGIPPDRVGGL